MTVTIRPARAEDFSALADLWVGSWQSTMPGIDFAARRPWFLDHMAALQAAGAHVLVAASPDKLLGFVTVDPATQVMDQLAVADVHAGKGVGSQLIEAAKARSPSGLRLSVNTDNPRAISLYRRHGFMVVGEGRNARSGLPIIDMIWQP